MTTRRRRIYLARHGDVSYFDAAGRPVHPEGVELNDDGRLQARALAELLEPVAIDRVVTSGLPRTTQTAAPIAEPRGLEIEVCPALSEIRTGKLREIAPQEIRGAFLGTPGRGLTRSDRFLGGETFGAFVDRVLPCFRELTADDGWSALLVVAHGGVNRAILANALGAGLDAFETIEQDPGTLNIIDVDDDGRTLVRLLNHTPYEPAKKGIVHTTMERLFEQYAGGGGSAE